MPNELSPFIKYGIQLSKSDYNKLRSALDPYLSINPRQNVLSYSELFSELFIASGLEAEIYAQMEQCPGGLWRCLYCDCRMSRSNLFFHIEGKHMRSDGYYCKICAKFCSTLKAMNIHKSRFHKTNRMSELIG